MTKRKEDGVCDKAVRYKGSNLALAVWIQEKLQKIIEEKGATAVCGAVCADGGLLAAACAGKRGFDDSIAEADDLYNIGSVSKVYMAAAVMKLEQEGKLALDAPVKAYLPGWKLADERYLDITIRMLLNHSSGIPGTNLHDALDMDYEDRLFAGKYRNTSQYWETVKLRADPGSFSSYSNDGYDLLAEVVEAVTGEPYIEWLREQIAKPAGLESVGAGRWGVEDHVKVSCRGREPEYYNCFGAGAVHTTVPECALFGYLFVDSRGLIDQARLDETRRPQGQSFLKEAYDAANYCLGWDSRYTRNRIPLGDGAVIKDGGTEQFESYLLVSPACQMSLAISATSDSDVWWLEVLEEIGEEALRVLGRGRVQDACNGQTEAPGRSGLEVPREIIRRYSGTAYGSSGIYRFRVCGDMLRAERYGRQGIWEEEEALSGGRFQGNGFAKSQYDLILAEEHEGKVYYIHWGEAFCQKNSSYPSPGAVWPKWAGAVFAPVGDPAMYGGASLGKICLREINEDHVLVFATDHEDYPVVPLLCDSQRENETCLISETGRDGIVFRLEEGEAGVWLRMGLDRYGLSGRAFRTISGKPVEFRKPGMEDAGEIMAFKQEFEACGSGMDGTGILVRCDRAEEWIRYNQQMENAEGQEGLCCLQYGLFCREDGRLLGLIQIRLELIGYLVDFGGHIGYCVRPSERKKGYAKEMLRCALAVCREKGLGEVLVTCLEDNIGSARTIEACGGRFEKLVYDDKNYKANMRRYWIGL